MRERPIIFSGESVRSILEGRKTQTRRVIKPQPFFNDKGYFAWRTSGAYDKNLMSNHCPYGQPGDRIYVKETFVLESSYENGRENPPFNDGHPLNKVNDGETGSYWEQAHYEATDPLPELVNEDCPFEKCADNGCCQHWKSPLYMPRWASRITLEITGVRVERVQDITEEDAKKEGVEHDMGCPECWKNYRNSSSFASPKCSFWSLWDSINLKRGYGFDKNPWVFVLEFKKI